jgi:colanic acid biosynthesis glycosyl transferase WcaI
MEATPSGPLRIQLWSYNYDPEPTGIAVISRVLAHGLRDRGHQVTVIAAHPHYPEPLWGRRLVPYRELRDGIEVLRLPLWIGRATAAERYRQELSFLVAQAFATPFLGRPDVIISTSPSFPALLPAVVSTRLRKVPWVLWLHDVLPDGATATGIVDEHAASIRLARRLERIAYRAADRIVVLSKAFAENLSHKGVETGKIELIYAPATRAPADTSRQPHSPNGLRVLSMGNIGHSQGLTELLRGFERRPDLNRHASFVITGTGVTAEDAKAEIVTNRVQMPGLIDDDQLEHELQKADVAFVSQRYAGSEFNIPSKMMNFMTYGLPILAVVNPSGEVARIVRDSGAGWVVDSGDPDAFPVELERISQARGEILERSAKAVEYANQHFSEDVFAGRFEQMLQAVARR